MKNKECKSCRYYEPDHGMFCMNGWSGDGTTGECKAEPVRVPAVASGTCRHHECPEGRAEHTT